MPYKKVAGTVETCTVSGSTVTLTGAVSPFLSFAGAGYANTDTARVTVAEVDTNGNANGDWVKSLATFNTGGTLTLSDIEINSAGGTTVPTMTGTIRVWVTEEPTTDFLTAGPTIMDDLQGDALARHIAYIYGAHV
jgi:hypothetical protein